MSRRLIEGAFPLREASLDSVHEKNVRHGHVSTLHICPARRPLAACRAALLATLLPDPGTAAGRRALRRRIGGLIEEKAGPDGRMREATVSGILHWGREGGPELGRFREEIREAFGGRTPRVFDPFAGGGAIPLEGMRLGCEVVASDINPVAWFVLRCALHYPRLVAGETRPLPDFALRDGEFVAALTKARGARGRGRPLFPSAAERMEADFAWHLRAWGRRVLARARRTLAARYPTLAEFEPVRRKGRRRGTAERPFERRAPRLLVPDAEGRVSTRALNAGFGAEYLADEGNPRFVAKPTVAYLWARTAACPNCRAEIPLLKTRWLARKHAKRALLGMEPREDGTGVDFTVETTVPVDPGGAADRREAERTRGAGTMSRAGRGAPAAAGRRR